MSFAPGRVADFLAHIAAHPTHGERSIAKALGIPRSSASRLLRAHRKGQLQTQAAPAPAAEIPKVGVTVSDTVCDVVTENPCTLDELIRVCKVDTKVWRVERHVVNKWEVGSRNEDGSVTRTPLFQIKAWLERIPGQEIAEAVRDTIAWIKTQKAVPAVPARRAVAPTTDDSYLLEIDPCDLHLDKLAWQPESGDNWDMKISSGVHLEAVDNLCRLAAPFPAERILYICGNDFFTADNPFNTTTAGTPQAVDGRWQKSFQVGVALQQKTIEFLRSKARGGVDVVVVPGNHDTTRAFYMGCVLEAMYSGVKDVRVFNSPSPRKYYRWGTTLLGFTHGHAEKLASLPLIMAGEAPKDWAETTHREIHCGHYHHKRETQFHAGNEIGPVRVRILPSLSATDAWHSSSGYVGAQRAAECYVWSQRRGYTGHFSWSPLERRRTDVIAAA